MISLSASSCALKVSANAVKSLPTTCQLSAPLRERGDAANLQRESGVLLPQRFDPPVETRRRFEGVGEVADCLFAGKVDGEPA